MTDTLGDRIKRYEAVFNNQLVPKTPVIIRVDGKAFHTFTKDCKRPFDYGIINAMTHAARMTAGNMQGFKLGYVQSDEATFVLTDTDRHETQGWFNHEINKIVSLSASLFTGYFNAYYGSKDKTAFFDSRAFSVPAEEVPNVLIWRQRDWERNSVQMLARAHFSHAECNKKKIPELHEMLHTKGVNWAKINDIEKNGTFIERNLETTHNKENYETLSARFETVEL